MKRKISILFAICLLCALASGCSGEKSVSKVELPAVVPESPAQESVTPESTAQDLPEQNARCTGGKDNTRAGRYRTA